MSDPFSDFTRAENSLWDKTFGDEFVDSTAQALFHEAYFNPGAWEPDQLAAIRENLNAYLAAEYDINFDDVFDWDAWREAYEGD